MPRTDDLIAKLSSDVGVVRPHAAARRLAIAGVVGASVAFVMLVLSLGIRPDFVSASLEAPFWMKWMFTLSLAGFAFVVVKRLGQPEAKVGPAIWGVIASVVVVELMGLGEWLSAEQLARPALVMGHTALRCSAAIPLLAVPVFIALMRAFARLTPTRLALTGAMSGLLAGALGATVYAFACPEHAAAFMAVWYCLGILASGALGALIGPRFLKW
jgi:hypothetical protein